MNHSNIYELLQHETSGERYAAEVDQYYTIIGCCGPLDNNQITHWYSNPDDFDYSTEDIDWVNSSSMLVIERLYKKVKVHMDVGELEQARRYADAFAFRTEQEITQTPGAKKLWKDYMEMEVRKAREFSARMTDMISDQWGVGNANRNIRGYPTARSRSERVAYCQESW